MANYQRISFQEIKNRLRSRTDGIGIFWGPLELRDAINEALRVWNALTGYWTTTFNVPTNSDVYQTVPSQITTLQRVQYNGAGLTLTSVAELDYGNPNWEAIAPGTPIYWAPIGINQVAFNPPPMAQNSLVFEGVQETPQLTNDSDFINIGDEELTRILDYAQHYLSFKEGPPEFDNTLGAYKEFLRAAGIMNSKLKDTALYKRAMGLVRDEMERPSTSPNETVGIRS